MTSRPLTNWAGNIEFSTGVLHRPTSLAELQQIVAGSERLRVLGTAHSFNTVADSGNELVSIAALPRRIEVDTANLQVTVSAGTRYGELAVALDAAGLALHNLGSLPHISIGGAVATGTHGSGRGNANLASAVAGLELVTADGEPALLRRGDESWDGSVVTLGCLGVVTALTFDVQPRYEVEQRVYDGLPWTSLRKNLLELMDAAYSVSVFLTFEEPLTGQIWAKHRTDRGDWPHGEEWLGARLANGPRHPVPGMDPASCTEQGGVPGPWHERLPHFRLGFTPSSGEELQTEYLLPAEHAGAALDVLAGLAGVIAPVLQVSELRTIAADRLWLSEAYLQDSIALHFTWLRDPAAVAPVLRTLEERLVPLGARAHWGKVFSLTPAQVADGYPRIAEACRLITSRDPKGKLRNDFVNRYLFDAELH